MQSDCASAELANDQKAMQREKNKVTKLLKEFGLQAPESPSEAKNFVLDTNVLLHDPGCLNRFTDNHLCIPADVLSELDKFKNEQTERGANARQVHRKLTEVFSREGGVTQGVKTEGGGTIRMVIYDPNFCVDNSDILAQFLRIFPDKALYL